MQFLHKMKYYINPPGGVEGLIYETDGDARCLA